jgi:F0F1-type ATP synthase delta subunit
MVVFTYRNLLDRNYDKDNIQYLAVKFHITPKLSVILSFSDYISEHEVIILVETYLSQCLDRTYIKQIYPTATNEMIKHYLKHNSIRGQLLGGVTVLVSSILIDNILHLITIKK